MAAKKKNENEFVPDLSVAGGSSNLDLGGFDKPPVADEQPTSTDEPLISLVPGEKPKRKYTKRNSSPKEGDDLNLEVIDGEDIQMFIDLVLPIAISGIHNMTSKEKMSPDVIMLTPKQETKMNRLAQKAADYLKAQVKINPVVALTIGVTLAYGGNYMKNKP